MKRYTFSTLLLSLTLTCFNPINQQVFGQKTTINTGKSLQITENALTTILEKNRANYKEGKEDNTNLRYDGAKVICEFIIQTIKKTKLKRILK